MKNTFLILVAIVFASGAFAQNKTYKVGDVVPELGGIVVYIDLTGKHGIVCPDVDQGSFDWGCREKELGVTSDGVFAGKQNTKDILNKCSEANTAAKICNDLVLYGFDDWYLPSLYELNLMYKNLYKKGIGNFDNTWYWSSTENSSSYAWLHSFIDGGQYNSNKNNKKRVRAVRDFSNKTIFTLSGIRPAE
jgi:hypothetical protein